MATVDLPLPPFSLPSTMMRPALISCPVARLRVEGWRTLLARRAKGQVFPWLPGESGRCYASAASQVGGWMVGMEEVDCAVIGAGVVGLAAARALARAGHEVLILESESSIGTGASSRNSEVIHAGMYYPPGSLKARFCVEGNRRLREFPTSHKVPHKRVGKLIVATGPTEEKKLNGILERGTANGVEGLIRIDVKQAQAMEPQVACTDVLYSPATGIIDTHSYMLALLGE